MMKTDNSAVRKTLPGCSSLFGKFGLDGNALKLLAIVLMVIDHVGAVLYPGALSFTIFSQSFSLLRVIGRISFPIFAFLLSEGGRYTSNWKKYAARLGILFLVSEPFYDMLFHGAEFYPANQNIFLTLLIGLLMIRCDMRLKESNRMSDGVMREIAISLIGCVTAELLHADYGFCGALMIYWFYCAAGSRLMQIAALVIVNVFLYGGIQCFAVLAAIPLCLYNGKPGIRKKWIQWSFYLFYPIHLILLLVL